MVNPASVARDHASSEFPPWLRRPLQQVLATHRGHALLLQGPAGVGQFELALAIAQAWLCEQVGTPTEIGIRRPAVACGHCPSCKLFLSHTHPDLMLLVPDALRDALGWGMGEDAESSAAGEKSSPAKPSKEIKVDAVRRAVAFSQTTSARGLAKVLLVHPAEQMNHVAANSLLKTLEEPPGQALFILCTAEPTALLATVRSRCQSITLTLPDTNLAVAWLSEHGAADAEVLLQAAGGQTQAALEWAEAGLTARAWLELPSQIYQRHAGPMLNWPLPQVIASLQKMCHDALCLASGAKPRYFVGAQWPKQTFNLHALTQWSKELQSARQHAEHPWNQPLAVQVLVDSAASVLRHE